MNRKEIDLLKEYFIDSYEIKDFYDSILIDASQIGVRAAILSAMKNEYFLLYSSLVGFDPMEYLEWIREGIADIAARKYKPIA